MSEVGRPAFVRFVLLRTDADSGRRQGILTAANELRREGELSRDEHRTLRLALEWFSKNVNSPDCLEDPASRRALSWFKATAKRPIERMWNLVSPPARSRAGRHASGEDGSAARPAQVRREVN